MSGIKALFAVAVTGALIAACMPGSDIGDDDDITLTYAFFAPAESFPGVQMQRWKDEIEERTDGQVTVELFPGSTLLGSGDIYDGVAAGTVDIGLDSPAYDTSRFPFSSVINQPLGIADAQTASQTFLDLLEEYEPSEFDDFEIITAFTTEAAYFQTESPITAVSDARGQELRASGAVVPVLEQMDSAPIGMAMSEVGENLRLGVISGYVSSREVLQDFGLAEHVGYVTDYPLGISNSFVAVMDRESFEALPDHVQEVIGDLRREMTETTSVYHDEENVGAALDWAAAEHDVEIVDLSDAERQVWDDIMESVVDAWVAAHADADFDAGALVERARELAAEYQAGSD